MMRSGGTFLQFCGFAVLAAMPWAMALGQDVSLAQATPEASPAASPVTAASPAASPAAAAASPSARALANPPASPGPAVTGTGPTVSGTAPVVSGTVPVVSGTAPTASGTAPAVSGTGAVPSPTPPSIYSIEINLGTQWAYLLKNGKKFAQAPISSGRAGHLTPEGNFAVIQKDLNHFSNLYGRIVEKDSGRVVKSGADVATPVPKGCKFEPAPMKWFMRFDGAAGMHAGILPGYPASHGCVRMPLAKAQLFYQLVDIGTPVHVFGTTPVRASREEEPHGHAASTPKPAPTPVPAPTPKRKHGWWF